MPPKEMLLCDYTLADYGQTTALHDLINDKRGWKGKPYSLLQEKEGKNFLYQTLVTDLRHFKRKNI